MDVLYYVFSAQYHIHVQLDPTDLVAANVLVRDEQINVDAFSHDFDPDELATGTYLATPFRIDDLYREHWAEYTAANAEPVLRLTVTATYRTWEGDQVITKQFDADQELGWTVLYNEVPSSSGPFARQTTRRQLLLRTYEQIDTPPSLVVGDLSAVENGAISVSVEANGIQVSSTSCWVLTNDFQGYGPDGAMHTYYTATLVIPIPDSFPTHGTAHFTITQKLQHSGRIVTFEQELEY